MSEARADARTLTADSKSPSTDCERQKVDEVWSGELRREPGEKTMSREGLPDMEEYVVGSEGGR